MSLLRRLLSYDTSRIVSCNTRLLGETLHRLPLSGGSVGIIVIISQSHIHVLVSVITSVSIGIVHWRRWFTASSGS